MEAVAQIVQPRSVCLLVERLNNEEQETLKYVDYKSWSKIGDGKAEMHESWRLNSADESSHVEAFVIYDVRKVDRPVYVQLKLWIETKIRIRWWQPHGFKEHNCDWSDVCYLIRERVVWQWTLIWFILSLRALVLIDIVLITIKLIDVFAHTEGTTLITEFLFSCRMIRLWITARTLNQSNVYLNFK